MSKIVVLFLALILISCVFFKSKKNFSSWKTLDYAEDLTCNIFPLQKKDIKITWLKALKGKKVFGFFWQSLTRSGSSKYYYAPNNQIKNIRPVSNFFMEQNIILAGGLNIDKEKYTVFLKNINGTELEIKNIKNNVTSYSIPIKYLFPDNAQIFQQGDNSFWIKYNVSNLSYILFIKLYNSISIKTNKPIHTNFSVKYFPRVAIKDPLKLILLDKSIIIIWLEKRGSYRFQQIFADGSFGKKLNINLPIKSEVESWDVALYKNNIFLGYVEGDSLIGSANLKVARISLSNKGLITNWVKSKSLLNEHVSEPKWLIGQDEVYLLIPKWVDGETTVASYGANLNGFTSSRVLGVFPLGAYLINVFKDIDNKYYGILRYKVNGFRSQDFKMCKLF